MRFNPMSVEKKSKSARERLAATVRPAADPIAIVGIGCRYPGASTPQELWQALMAGKDCVGRYPGGRFAELDRLYEDARRAPGRLLTDRGGFLSEIDGFDAQFFEISPRESIYIDPQHRLLLEVASEALEDAGQIRESYAGSATGVYTGLWTNEYETRLYESATERDFYTITGCGRSSASGRLSFTFGFQGPSITVDTACSSSLVAVHMACQALWSGEIDMALAGGANVILGTEISELFSHAKMLSPDGRCKFGDASADGFVRSEGVGIVVLKRHSRALADSDSIYAVIRGGAVNNDGRSSGLLVTPSRDGQREMLKAAWKSAQIEPKDLRYIEMHGTGTSVGDPVEIEAVGMALAETGVTRSCALGSIKTNLGHTESASGVAGLIKTALALQHRTVPPSLHFHVPNPKVAWDSLPVHVAGETFSLAEENSPLLAGVSSFGITGTNAHVVLQGVEQPAEKISRGSGPFLLPVSARGPEALHALLREHLEQMRTVGASIPIHDVCYTASVRRNHHEYRAAIVGEDIADLRKNLVAAVEKEDNERVVLNRAGAASGKIVFVASGQGSQWLGMARELFAQDAVFRQAFEQCDAAIAAETGWHLTDRVLGADAERFLSQIDVIQPSLFAQSISLAAVWQSWGIVPDAVVGHSMGEVAAAHIAGILTLADAVAVICRRSRRMKTLNSAGGMATVELPLAEVENILRARDGVSVAASNGPHTTVISGDNAEIEALLKELESKEIYCRRIKVDVASHSAQVDPILDGLFASLTGIAPRPGRVPMLSTVTGEYVAGIQMDADYWVKNLRHSVLFAPAIEKLSLEGHDTFIELSPHPILLPSIEASARRVNPRTLAVASLRRDKPERATLLSGLAALYASGHKVAWERLYPEGARCVPLPPYPFQRERCWPEPADPARLRLAQQADDTNPLLGRSFESSLQPDTHLWQTELEISALPYLNDHRVLRSAVLPASAYIEMVLSAAKSVTDGQAFEMREVAFLSAMYLPDNGRKAFQLALVPEDNGVFRFDLRGRADQAENADNKNVRTAWTLHSTGIVTAVEPGSAVPATMHLAELKSRCPVHRSHQELYEKTAKSGLHYGPAFQRVEEAWIGPGESLCGLRCDIADGTRYGIHPALLDACFQAAIHVIPEEESFPPEATYLPVRIERFRIYRSIPVEGGLFARATLIGADAAAGSVHANLWLADAEGNVLADVVGMELMRVAGELPSAATESLYSLDWIFAEAENKTYSATQADALLPSKLSAENWLIFADSIGIAEAMKHAVETAGGLCTLVRPGSGFRKIAEAEFEINPRLPQDLERLLAEAALNERVLTAVVHLWTLDTDSFPAYGADGLIRSQALGSQSVPTLVQAIAKANLETLPRLWLVTAGAITVAGSTDLPRIENAPMWGIGLTVAREHPELRTTLVDLSGTPDSIEALRLVLEMCADRREDRIALRGNATYLARITHFSPVAAVAQARQLADGEQYGIEIPAPGILDNLELRANSGASPRPGEVGIQVVAAGLNFIDVTKVMGIYPGLDPAKPIRLGIECSGRVTAVGEGVESIHVEDEVIAITDSMQKTSMLNTFVSVPAEMVLPKPPGMTFDQAATTPIAFLTAYYSLVELARIQRGEWVLIHAAAGGVGLAAVEIARWAGANIIATVGSPEKADYLRKLGLKHILDSRSLSFATGVMEITDGRGVDVVLNSLTGEFQSKGLEVLAPYGRFIELGKRDIYDDRRLGLKVFRRNLSFHAVDLAAAIEQRRSYIAELLHTVMRHIEAGDWQALPVRSFSAADPGVPFRFMAQARHIGKIAIQMDRDVRVLPANDRPLFFARATYLITGGLGGVALTVAEWMAENGAGQIVLLSRRAPSLESAEAIRRIEQAGATVITVRADVTSEADLVRVLQTIRASGFPLKGIMHTAAVVDDALIVDLSPERFLPVMAPKIAGTWNLHAATLSEELDFFVLFSSIAAVHPQPGMGSYAAANAFMDSFAQYLRLLGKPAMSVNWGGWDRIGLARAAGTGRSIEGYALEGMNTFSGKQAVELLRRALETNPSQVMAVPIDAERFAKFHGPNDIPPVFSGLMTKSKAGADGQPKQSEILEQLTAADPGRQRQEIIEGYLQEVLGRVLKLATRKIDRERPLGSMGLDSLMGLEFVRRLSNALEIPVPATVVFNYPTIQQLAAHLLKRMRLDAPDELKPAEETSANGVPVNRKNGSLGKLADGMSEEDALQALMGNGQRSS